MRTTGIWWLLGVTSIALLGTSAAWSAGAREPASAAPHRGATSAHASLRRSMGTLLAFTPAPAPPVEAPRMEAPHVARPRVQHPVAILVEDEPPPPSTPLTWDELFPTTAGAGRSSGNAETMSPCFDQLQGVEGLSPCPAGTPRRP